MFLIRNTSVPGMTLKGTRKEVFGMNRYTLEAVVDGEYIKFDRTFESRNAAIDYIFRYYENRNMVNVEVNDEYCVDGNKHDIAYVYNYYNRFRIARA